jgi:hypothetical protein
MPHPNFTMTPTTVTDPGCLSRSPDPNFSIPELGSEKHRILDPGPQQRINVILIQKLAMKLLSRIRSVFLSRILGSEKDRIPDPQHCILLSQTHLVALVLLRNRNATGRHQNAERQWSITFSRVHVQYGCNMLYGTCKPRTL